MIFIYSSWYSAQIDDIRPIEMIFVQTSRYSAIVADNWKKSATLDDNSAGTDDLCVPKIPKITQNFKILKDVATFSILFSTPLHEKSSLRPFRADNLQKWRYHNSATADEFSKIFIYVPIGCPGRYQSSILADIRPYGMIFIHTGRLKFIFQGKIEFFGKISAQSEFTFDLWL